MKKTVLPLFPLLFLSLCGCSTAAISSSSTEDPIEENQVRVSVEEGKASIKWNASGYNGFKVYGSDSKYGNYHLLSGESPILESSFLTTSHRYGYYKIVGIKEGREEEFSLPASVFGEETLIIDVGDDMEKVQAEIEERHSRLESGSEGQFSSERFATLFYPGDYPDIEMKLGYYTTSSGLGKTPFETSLGSLFVSTEVLDNNNSTCTFWRSASNLSFPESTQFAVSQATSLRRCHFRQNLYLSHPSGWSSGGFLADSLVEGRIESRTQQQWMTRNSSFSSWVGASHNYVFSGCVGGVPADSWSEATSRTSVEETSSRIAEAPFLYSTQSGLNVFIPSLRTDASGLSYSEENMGEGRSVPLDDFYVANPEKDDADSLNSALSKGKSILFSPGNYLLKTPLRVSSPDSILMGVGYATLLIDNKNGRGAIEIDDVDGVRISSLLLDAGEGSNYMLRAGSAKSNIRHEDNPLVLSDLFCRIGGKANEHTEVDNAVLIHSNDVIGDNLWLWRADHSQGVAWEDTTSRRGGISYGNPCKTGLFVEGNNATFYALMVEHFEEYQVLWKGENGKTVMFQCEVPYNVPSQEAWQSENGQKDGYAAYKVDDGVTSHFALGLGVYWVHYTHDFLENAFECPTNEGVKLRHLVTTTFSGYENGGIRHVVNGLGDGVGEGGKSRALFALYPQE